MTAANSTLYRLAEQQAAYCAVFGSTNRVLILWALGSKEMAVSDISAATGLSLQNTSQHLRLMKDRDILTSRREGHSVYYRISASARETGCPILSRAMQDVSPETHMLERRASRAIDIRKNLMTIEDLTSIEAAKIVDARGSACPGPLLEAKKGIGAVSVGDVLEIWSGDANTKNDIPRWATKVGHEYLGVVEADGYDRIFIKRLK